MFELHLQHFKGTGMNAKNLIEIQKMGKFIQPSHAWEKIETVLKSVEEKGYIVDGTCYYTKDGSESFALQIVEQGIPLY